MNQRKILVILLASLLAGISGCSGLDALQLRRPSASLNDVKIQDMTLKSATLLFDVEIDNPYSAPLPLMNVDYKLQSNASPLFDGNADIQSTIPANSKKIVSLPVKIGYLDVVRAFKDVRPGSKVPYQADVGLSLNAPAVGKLRLPIKKSGEMAVPAIPKADDLDLMKLLEQK